MKIFVMNKSLFQCQKKILKKKFFTQHDVENKQLKEENEKWKKEESEKLRNEENEKLRNEENEKLRKENERLRKNNEVKDVEIKESIEKPIEWKFLKKIKIRQILILIGLTKISLKTF